MFNKKLQKEIDYLRVVFEEYRSVSMDRLSKIESDIDFINRRLEKAGLIFDAMLNFLELETKYSYEDDPNYIEPDKPQVKVCKLHKRRKK